MRRVAGFSLNATVCSLILTLQRRFLTLQISSNIDPNLKIMDGHEKPALLALAPLDAIPGALPPVDSTRWEKWFQPGEDTSKSVALLYLKPFKL